PMKLAEELTQGVDQLVEQRLVRVVLALAAQPAGAGHHPAAADRDRLLRGEVDLRIRPGPGAPVPDEAEPVRPRAAGEIGDAAGRLIAALDAPGEGVVLAHRHPVGGRERDDAYPPPMPAGSRDRVEQGPPRPLASYLVKETDDGMLVLLLLQQ